MLLHMEKAVAETSPAVRLVSLQLPENTCPLLEPPVYCNAIRASQSLTSVKCADSFRDSHKPDLGDAGCKV